MKNLLIVLLLIPVIFLSACSLDRGKTQTATLNVYFGNTNLNPNSIDCNKVYPVARTIAGDAVTPNAALQELFKGPSQSERDGGYTSWFSVETENILKSVKVSGGVAQVDLADIRQLIPNASTSCGSGQLLSGMEATLKQFPEIKKVIFSIDGQPDIFYEWLQLSTPSL